MYPICASDCDRPSKLSWKASVSSPDDTMCVCGDKLESAVITFDFFLCFAAEKVTSLGKDWHRPCLRCEKCSKTLSPGSHAEVR